MDRFLSRYSALCVLALFLGIQYKVGVVLRPFDALIGLGGLFLVGRASVRGRIDRLKKPTVYYLFVAAYSYRCVNALFLSGTGTALKEAVQVTEFVLLVHIISVSTRSKEHRRLFFRMLLVGSGLLVLGSVGWHVSNGYYAGYKQWEGAKLAFSIFALLALGRFLRGESRYTGIVFFVAVVLMVLSGERKGWVAFLGGAGLMYLVYRGQNVRHLLATIMRPRVLVGGTLAVVGIVVVGLQFERVVGQFKTIGDVYVLLSNFDLRMDLSAFETSSSNLARLYALIFTIRTTIDHPWFGIGTDQWLNEIRAVSHNTEGSYVLGAHSEYQRFAVENGLTGLTLYVFTWVYALQRSVWIFRRNRNSREGDLLVVLGFSAFGVLVNFLLGGGALNILFMALVVGLLVGLENDPNVVS